MDDKGMSRSVRSMWLLIVIAISLFVLGIIVVLAINSGSEANNLSKLGADFRILNVQKVNYEDINVTLKKTSYEENIESVKFIFYDNNGSEIKEYDYTIEEIERNALRNTFYIENTSRVYKVSVYSFKRSKLKNELVGRFQDVYEVPFNGTIFNPPKDETGYSREKILNCTYASDCKDNNPCTVGSCSNGICSYPTIPGCKFCSLDKDCEDNNSCTSDSCINKKCNHTLINECEQCENNEECEDNNPCTLDECLNKKCNNTLIPDCKFCSSKSDCDDDNPCTEDICSNNKCSHLNIPGCIYCTESSECGIDRICVNSICVVSQNISN